MKKLSNRDWAIALVIGGLFFIIGFAVKGIFGKVEVINIENPINIKLQKSNDSLEALVYYRDSLIAESEKRQAISDSIIIMNNRQLRREYEKIKNFTPDRRAQFVDSILRRTGIRR